MATPFECFESGNLSEAIRLATHGVRDSPGDIELRSELVTYLCFEGDFDRVQKHLKMLLGQANDMAADLLVMNGLLRGEIARGQCFTEGRLPRFSDHPSEYTQDTLKALTLLASEPGKTRELLREGIERHAKIQGSCDGSAFSQFRDCDDMTALILEAITMSGDYFWLAYDEVKRIELAELKSPQDVIWRAAKIWTRTGDEVTAFLPGLYPGTNRSSDEWLKIGRAAEFKSDGEGPVRGIGGRMYLIDGEQKPFALIRELVFTN